MSTPCTDIPTDVLCDILDNVEADPKLSSEEKEFSLGVAADEGRFHVYAAIPSLIRLVLIHPESEVERIYVTDEENPRIAPEHYTSGSVTAIWGEIPIGCLKISETSRSTTALSRIFANSVYDNDPRKE